MLVREVMTKNPKALQPESTVFDALALMTELEVRHVPIVSEGQLIGLISDRDLRPFARASLEDTPKARERLRVRLSDVMSSDVLSIEEEEDIDEAIDLLVENKVGAIPVTDPEGNLTGILSVIDVLRVAQGRL